MRWVAILSALLCISATVIADSTNVKTAPAGGDTTLFVPVPNDRDSALVIDTTDLERHLYQNPTVALFKSMVVPGLGQVGNHSYIKAALFAGLEVWFVSSAIDYGRQAGDYRKLYDAATTIDTRNQFYALYKDRRDERNKYIWFTGITIFVSMFDAYVDAHLSGSPTSGRGRRVGFDVGPDGRGGTAVQLAVRF